VLEPIHLLLDGLPQHRIVGDLEKEVTASDLFRRLNSYSKQHALYRVLKAFGQVPKSLFI
jgi:TnpA family transposase